MRSHLLRYSEVRKRLLLIAILILSIQFAFGQVTFSESQENLQKYWYYRFRLRNDFLIAGLGQGHSLPMSERAQKKQASGLWGDTQTQLGYYIGVLATEYKILRDNGQPTAKTAEELFYAMKALERTDVQAEPFFPGGFTTTPNGFFIRDDCDSLFIQRHFDHFNQNITSQYFQFFTSSDGWPLGDRKNEISKDQYTQMLVGLILVTRLVHPAANHNGYNFVVHAKNHADRIVKWIKNGPSGSNLLWTIQNPVTGQNVLRGEFCQDIAYGLAATGCYAQGKGKNCTDYHDGFTYTLGYAIWSWNILRLPPHCRHCGVRHVCLQRCTDSYMPLTLAALSNSATSRFTGNPFTAPNVTRFAMAKAQTMGIIHCPLLWGYLHNKNIEQLPGVPRRLKPLNYTTTLLNRAPCEGPFWFPPSEQPDSLWSTKTVWLHPHKMGNYPARAIVPPRDSLATLKTSGEYNGLDYMLLHNLYYLQYSSSFAFASQINLMDRVFNINIPITAGSHVVGNKTNPIEIGGFQTLESRSIIDPDGDATFRAGKVICLKDGFHAQEGADFVATIQPFTCANGQYERKRPGLMSWVSNDTSAAVPLSYELEEDLAPFNTNPESALNLYPNPTAGNVNVQLESDSYQSGQLSIINVEGRVAYSKSVSLSMGGNIIQLNDLNLSAGSYMVVIKTERNLYNRPLIVTSN